MKFSESWLRQWVNPKLSTDELVAQITMAGLEVDSVASAAPQISRPSAAWPSRYVTSPRTLRDVLQSSQREAYPPLLSRFSVPFLLKKTAWEICHPYAKGWLRPLGLGPVYRSPVPSPMST